MSGLVKAIGVCGLYPVKQVYGHKPNGIYPALLR